MGILRDEWLAMRAMPAGTATGRRATMPSSGPAAEDARADVRALIAAKGHAVDNAREVAARLEQAFADGALQRTRSSTRRWRPDGRARAGRWPAAGRQSAEASRFILRAIDRGLDDA